MINAVDAIFENFVPLETGRLILRKATDDDYKAVFEIYSDKEAVRYQGISPMTTILQAKKTLEVISNGYKNKRFVRWGIFLKHSDKLVGFITLHTFDKCSNKAEIGYMLNKQYWNKNIMTEAAAKVIDYAFNVVGLNRIEALVHPKNAASIRLCEKLGFHKEGIKKGAFYDKNEDEFEDSLIFAVFPRI